ncbi:hypothetical protein HMPREF9443_00686, partial [Phascolarctobacterium succinatutens YIT 12067]
EEICAKLLTVPTSNLSHQHPTILFNELDNVLHVITPWLYYIIRTEYVQALDTQKEDGAHRPLFIYAYAIFCFSAD